MQKPCQDGLMTVTRWNPSFHTSEALTGAGIKSFLADAGYKGHNAPLTHIFRVFTIGQKRGVAPQIKRLMKRRSAVEPVIGHIKNEHRMNRCEFTS
jgi:transposase, IS5 family